MRDATSIQVLAGIAAGLTTIAVFFRRLCALARAPVLWCIRQDKAAKDISRILAEVMPNGGGSMRDIVARMELRCNLGEQITRAILSDASHGVFQADASGRYVWVNSSYCRMVSRLPDDIYGNGWESYVHPDERDRVSAEWAKAVAAKREFGARYQFAGGGPVVDVVAHPLKDTFGHLLGYQGSMRVAAAPAAAAAGRGAGSPPEHAE